MGKVSQIRSVEPLRTNEFGADAHKVQRFNAVVDGTLTKEDLEKPSFWSNVAKNFTAGNTEIRIVAEDMSFVAYAFCTYAQGTTAKNKITSWVDLDEVIREEVVDLMDDYIVLNKGVKKWCIIKKSTGEVINEGIDKQAQALKELDEYKQVLGS